MKILRLCVTKYNSQFFSSYLNFTRIIQNRGVISGINIRQGSFLFYRCGCLSNKNRLIGKLHCEECENKESKEAHRTSIFFDKEKLLLYINRTTLAIIFLNFKLITVIIRRLRWCGNYYQSVANELFHGVKKKGKFCFLASVYNYMHSKSSLKEVKGLIGWFGTV